MVTELGFDVYSRAIWSKGTRIRMDEAAQGDCLNMRLLKEKVQAIQSIPGYGAGRGRVLGFPMRVGGAADYCSIA